MPEVEVATVTDQESPSNQPATGGATSDQPSAEQGDTGIKPPTATETSDPTSGGSGTGGGAADSSGIGE